MLSSPPSQSTWKGFQYPTASLASSSSLVSYPLPKSKLYIYISISVDVLNVSKSIAIHKKLHGKQKLKNIFSFQNKMSCGGQLCE
jgi:hypothetical protein